MSDNTLNPMESKNIRYVRSKIIHQLGNCQDCGMYWDDYTNGNARKQAKAHAKKTGHRVTGETGTGWSYN